ncbi:MAG: S9 family peptidase [Actinobacteria bacterium]|nr:S9 family peptidase [Actinomycetota bacterium]
MTATQAPFGSWESPITADVIASGGVSLSGVMFSPSAIYWHEGRPAEGGRVVVVRCGDDGQKRDLTPPEFNVRTRVHEYGGGSAWLYEEALFFTNFEDQRLYRQDQGGPPVAITPEPPSPASVRYGDGRVTGDGSAIVCVRETHGEREAVNDIAILPADGSAAPQSIVSGHDFFSSPRLSEDGSRLAWLSWDHPRMPWDGTELWVMDFDGRPVGEARLVAGGPEESIFQPSWGPDGLVYFVSDRTGWWNLYRERDGEIEALAPMDAELGYPQWELDMSTYAFLPKGRIGALAQSKGDGRLVIIDPDAERVEEIDMPYTAFSPTLRARGSELGLIAAGPTAGDALVLLETESKESRVIRAGSEIQIDSAYISAARSIEFPTENGLSAHALFYAPANANYVAPADERPPLVVFIHGGPTAHAGSGLDLDVQFWTSRGFAVVDVNYGGSTGYGRAYRERLNGQWGVVDTQDCVNAANYLAESGEVDPNRLAIRGGSAGGYTTLCALTFHDLFGAGANYFGVADAETMTTETHKFESRYLETLIGPYPAQRELFRQRSPVHFADQISAPLIVLQGLEDEIVPPSQSEQIVNALRDGGVPHAYLTFEGEQHGFRRAATIKRALEAELYFYSWVWGFAIADDVEPITIN